MSNRKYAAGLLEGGTHTEKERMDSVMVFVRQFVEESIEEFLASPEKIEDEYTKGIFEDIGQGKFIELAPDLAHKYRILVGLSEITSGIIIGYGEKPRRYGWSRDNTARLHSDLGVDSLDGSHTHTFASNRADDIARMINDSPTMGGSTAVHNLRTMSIRAGEIAANSIASTHIQTATIGSINADRILPYAVRERYGPAYIDPRAIAQFNLDGPARRASAPARLADIGTVGGHE